jgi:acetolactate synthase-1/2/3 large subunit
MLDQKSVDSTGADLVADFISTFCAPKVFLVTGGACAFLVDAIGRHKDLDYVCFQHEQAAAMAADAVWRTTGKIGVTLATSGPGATNLITGIACSWFDSIPSLHISGQVNQSESREAIGANVRQAGFQETDIVSMVTPITKWAVKIESVDQLIESLPLALQHATSGRMGPVLIDIPMNIQQAVITSAQYAKAMNLRNDAPEVKSVTLLPLGDFFRGSSRPLVVIGAGAALAGSADEIQSWCEKNQIPYVSSWGALTYLDRSQPHYYGSLGVYGSRIANWAVQAADKIAVLGSRLDNRQRTGNPAGFAPFAEILAIDIDSQELLKYKKQPNYSTILHDLRYVDVLLSHSFEGVDLAPWNGELQEFLRQMDTGFEAATKVGELNPYAAVRAVQKKFAPNSIVVSDCGANLCWVYQSYLADDSFLFTAGGNSPMGYSLPAAIGAQLTNPDKSVYCFIGDGGLQMNIQELQTIIHYRLPIKIFIQNNFGYGIIKQFQDAYFGGRHFATGEGYSVPDFGKIAAAYGIPYAAVRSVKEIESLEFSEGAMIIDIHLPPDSLITPKTEMDRFIHDQFPYIKDTSIERLPHPYPERPSQLAGVGEPTV